MENKSGMPQLLGLVLQVLGLVFFIITPSRVLPAGLVIIGAVIVLASNFMNTRFILADQYCTTMTLFSLILLLYYILFGLSMSTNVLMIAGLATAFVMQVISDESAQGKKADEHDIETLEVPPVETYFEESSAWDKRVAKDDYAEKKLDDEKKQILDELSDIQDDIVTLSSEELSENMPPGENLKLLFGKKDGKTFHTMDCLSLKNTDRKDLRVFNSTQEAKKNGYKPCRICKPK